MSYRPEPLQLSLRMGTPAEWRFWLVIWIASATMSRPVRRSVTRWIEALVWFGLIGAGWLTITKVQGANARLPRCVADLFTLPYVQKMHEEIPNEPRTA